MNTTNKTRPRQGDVGVGTLETDYDGVLINVVVGNKHTSIPLCLFLAAADLRDALKDLLNNCHFDIESAPPDSYVGKARDVLSRSNDPS